MTRRLLPILLIFVGAAALGAAVIDAFLGGVTATNALLLGLAVPAAWLRITLEPAGYINLMPVVIFVSFALARPQVSILLATLAALLGVVIFERKGLRDGLGSAGEEAIPVLIATASLQVSKMASLFSGSWQIELLAAALVYAVVRVWIAALKAKVMEGVEVRWFFAGAGKPMTANLALFALIALGLSYLTHRYGGGGYFTLALATIALTEAYHPFKLLSDQREILLASLTMIAQAIDLKDAYTGRHSRDVPRIAVRIARKLGLPEPEVRTIRIAGILHDIGKVGVSGRIIRKPSSLDAGEMEAMRRHPVIGAEIMRPVELLKGAAEIVRHTHEHYNGSGYPDGLRAEEIPIGSRIVLVADAFNAMTTDRPYRKTRSKAEALHVLKSESGKQFEPAVVAALESVADLL